MAKRRPESSLKRLKKQRPEGAELQQYDYHLPVMLQESVDALVTNPQGIYVDGTMGGGGHTAAIMERLQTPGKVFAFDADPTAHDHCRRRFAEELEKGQQSRVVLLQENFFQARSMIEEAGSTAILGFLLDLGVSSRQLDSDSIGLSYRVNAPLRMNFGANGTSAEELISSLGEEEITGILRSYGEEPFARKIARRLIDERRATPLRTTFDLRDAVAAVVPQHLLPATLSRVFQAFRIAVNDELSILEKTLTSLIPFLASGGRAVVISYHSLEDRIVKNIFADFAKTSIPDPDNPRSFHKSIEPIARLLTRKPQPPSPEELQRNPRARSAKLRILEKI